MTSDHAPNEQRRRRPLPWHAVALAAVVFLVYLGGAYDFVMLLGPDEEYVRAQGWGDEGVAYFTDYPLALRLVWVVNLLAGLVAPVLLVLRATPAATAALVATLAQLALMVITFGLMARLEALGTGTAAFDVGILALTAMFWLSTRRRVAAWTTTAPATSS